MAYFPHDNFYSIEPDDASYEQMNARTAAKMMARQRQDRITNGPARLAGAEYIEDILEHMSAMEEETLPNAKFIGAHAAFALLPESLFLTINLLDRYCSRMVIQQQYYQLVGCAALLIAAKYVEKKGRVPPISRLKSMCCGLYSSDELKLTEMHVLNTLEWAIGHPTVDFYTHLRAAEERDDAGVEHMAAYLCEIALYHRDFVSTKPSMMARVSLALARAILGRHELQDDNWAQPEIVAFHALYQHLARPSPTLACKYATPDLSCVSQKLAMYMDEQAGIAQRAANPPSPPNELASKPSTIDSTPRQGCGAAVGSEGCLTPPKLPTLPILATPEYKDRSTQCPLRAAAHSHFYRHYLQLRGQAPHRLGFPGSVMDYPLPRILLPCEVMQRQDLLSLVDHCSKGCDYNRKNNVWSCPGIADLYPVCWFQDGHENADWLSMKRFEEMPQKYT